MTEINNENILYGTAADSAGSENTDGEKRFTQKELETLISERLKRERKNNTHLTEIKTVLDELKEKGVMHGDSYAALASELISRASDTSAATTEVRPVTPSVSIADVTEPPAAEMPAPPEDPMTPDIAPMTEDAVSDGAAPTPTEISADGKNSTFSPGEVTLDEVKALTAAFPGENVMNDLLSDGFKAFCEGRNGSGAALYGAFVRLKAMLSKPAVPSEDVHVPETDMTPTAAENPEHRGSSSFQTDGGAYAMPSLSPRQMALAKEAGMSYREYAALLETIPRKNNG